MSLIWHELSAKSASEELQVNLQKGLSDEQVVERLKIYGQNVLEGKKPVHPLIKFLGQFHDPLIYILLASTLITAFIKDIKDAVVIFLVVLLNAIIGYVQESKAEKATEALSKSVTTKTTVIRNSNQFQIESSGLVPGDLVFLQAGDKVPADIRLFYAKDLQASEAVLTGESVPVEKNADLVFEVNTPLGDRSNMLYSSTLITNGQGRGIVVATGNKTEIGKISSLISDVKELQTPLTIKIAKFSQILLYCILALAALTLAVGLGRGQELADTFLSVIALMVSMIPEGLPAALSVTLAIGVARMAKNNAIIRKMSAVETLGSTTVICSDKTGTLTQNEMTVQEIIAGGQQFSVSNVGYLPLGELCLQDRAAELSSFPALKECLLAGLLCNDSRLSQKEGHYFPEGDPTEVALIVSAFKAGIQDRDKESYPRIDVIPFSSDYKYMATLHKSPLEGKNVVYLKGSLESLIDKFKYSMNPDGSLSKFDRDFVVQNLERLSLDGMRVLVFGQLHLPSSVSSIDHQSIEKEIIFLGLQAMIDPARPEAIKAVATCQAAGIKVKMITGDHPLTALSIARKLGIQETLSILGSETEKNSFVLTGQELSNIPETIKQNESMLKV